MAYGSHPSALRVHKVRKIFDKFDLNKDEHLNRDEMSALVVAANPKVSFNEDQIAAILEEVFRTYGDYINGDKGLSFEGLLQTYDDGAGDIDRDFEALSLELDTDAAVPGRVPGKRLVSGLHSSKGARIRPPKNGIIYDDTWGLIEELEVLIKQLESKIESKETRKRSARMRLGSMGLGCVRRLSSEDARSPTVAMNGRRHWEEIGHDYLQFQNDLSNLRKKADRSCTQDEAFDAHMAMGRTLFDYGLYNEAVINFKRAGELKPMDARSHFQKGNSLYAQGKAAEAKEAYAVALSSGDTDVEQWGNLLPQIHVNLGVALEAEGMLLSACEHYKEAAIMEPRHYRALKLLGSALYGVGEYRSAKEALQEAILLHPNYADALCELGSVLHALGEHDAAVMAFEKALDVKNDHIEALFNLATSLKDTGHYHRAADIYSKVLKLEPGNWKAQINKAVCSLGAGDIGESRRTFREAYRMTRRIELYDAMVHLRQMEKRHKRPDSDTANKRARTGNDFSTAEPSRFKRANVNTIRSELLSFSLDMREFQRCTKFDKCCVADLRKELYQILRPVSISHAGEKFFRKESLEKVIRRLLRFLKPEAFQFAMKVTNERVLAALDPAGTGKVDVGMAFAIFSLVCGGPVDERKHTAFDALVFRSSADDVREISRQDVKQFLKVLQAAFRQSQGNMNGDGIIQDEDSSSVSFPGFVEMLDDPNGGFGVLGVLAKLEAGRHVWCGHTCSVCRYPITGFLFKETKADFSLCSLCYSSGKLPSTAEPGRFYFFKEYDSAMELLKDRLNFTCLEL